MKKFDPSKILAYTVGAVSFVFGVTVILGWWDLQQIPATTRNIFGVVLILLGIYRFAVTSIKSDRRE